MEEPVSLLAANQHGLVCRRQLLAMGLTRGAITSVLRGATPVQAGVYALRGAPTSLEQRVLSALFGARGGAVASHRSAAHLLGLGTYPDSVEISVPRRQRPRLRGVTVFRPTILPADHVAEVNGIAVTRPGRTIVDLATVVEDAELELVLDRGLSRRIVTCDVVRLTLDALPRHKGRATLLALLEARQGSRGHAESPLEQQLHRLLRRERLRGWKPQHPVGSSFIDVAFPDARLALEMESYLHHSSRTDWTKDTRKHRELVAAGWRVLRVTREDLREGRHAFLVELRRALGAALLRDPRT